MRRLFLAACSSPDVGARPGRRWPRSRNCPQAWRCARCGRRASARRVTPYCFPRWRSTASTPPPRTAPSPASKRRRTGIVAGQCGPYPFRRSGLRRRARSGRNVRRRGHRARRAFGRGAMARARIERGAIGAHRDRDLVIVRSADGRLFALDAKDGKRRWLFQRSSPPLSSVPRGHDRRPGYLLTGLPEGSSCRSRSPTAPCAGRRPSPSLAEPRNWNASPMSSGCRSSPSAKYAPWPTRGASAASTSRAQRALVARAVEHRGLGLDARYVFVSDEKGAVHALDRAGGATIWKQDRLFLRRLSAPLPLARDRSGRCRSYVHFLSRESGAFVGRIATDGSPIRSLLVRLERGSWCRLRTVICSP